MKLAFVSRHLPQEEGTAAGRQLWAVGEALRAAGHDVTAFCWRPEPAAGPYADWCEWRPLPPAAAVRVRSRALLLPRSDVVRAGWSAASDAVAVADDPGSAPAVTGQGCLDVTTVHFSVALDRAALHDRAPRVVQDWRGERRAVRRARSVWVLSDRVGAAVGRGTWVPPTVPVPVAPLPAVDEPVVGLLADWSWPPNRLAADALLRCWPSVRAEVPGARLLLAGRGTSPVGALAGVEWMGPVRQVSDLLGRCAVFAFPCPATSGPKMKVMDALAHGVAVVTTESGVEGLVDGRSAASVGAESSLSERLVALLRDPAARAALAGAGRQLLVQHHSPEQAALARVRAVQQQLAGARS